MTESNNCFLILFCVRLPVSLMSSFPPLHIFTLFFSFLSSTCSFLLPPSHSSPPVPSVTPFHFSLSFLLIHPSLPISEQRILAVDCNGIHIRALIVQIEDYTNKCTILQYKIWTLKVQNSDMFRPFHVGHPQGVDNNICIQLTLYIDKIG